MDRNIGQGMIGQQKNLEQVHYCSVETVNEGMGSSNQRFFQDPSGSINANIRPPDFSIPFGARPVLNYSIQTGEEFEFMRGVYLNQHLVPHSTGEPPIGSTSYVDLKGILGLSHTGSEAGSEISTIASVEKTRTLDVKRKNASVNEDKTFCQALPSRFQTSSRPTTSKKLKFLCSFGGKVLPRPGDGKPRYVGGDTHIIHVTKDISWHEFRQKILTIYSQDCTIKYQLPGEGLDALISVSCDEDLQNMMEECDVLDDGGSQKLRLFLFSGSDLDDSQFGIENVDDHSEFQYIVAVNGLDIGTKTNLDGFPSTSGNNLDEFLSLSIDRENGRVATGVTALDTVYPVGISPLTNQFQTAHHSEIEWQQLPPSQPSGTFSSVDCKSTVVPSIPNYAHLKADAFVVNSSHVPMTLEKGYGSSHVLNSEASATEAKLERDPSIQKKVQYSDEQSRQKEVSKEGKMKREASIEKINEPEKMQSLANDKTDSSKAHRISTSDPKTVMRNLARPSTVGLKDQDQMQTSVSSESVKEEKQDQNSEESHFTESNKTIISGQAGLEAYPVDPCSEQPTLPMRIYRSERIPRAQTGLNRLSKSDDSSASPLLKTHSLPEGSQQNSEPIHELDEGDVASQTEQLISSPRSVPANQPAVEDIAVELPKSQKVPDYAKGIVIEKELPAGTISEENPSGRVDTPKRDDMVIDLNDRFPQDLLSDTFPVVKHTGTGVAPLHGDRGGSSSNMENHEPQQSSYFQKLAQNDFVRRDVSLMDQDHLIFSPAHANIHDGALRDYSYPLSNVVGGVIGPRVYIEPKDVQQLPETAAPSGMNFPSEQNPSQTTGTQYMPYDGTVNSKAPEYVYQDEKQVAQNTGLGLTDISPGDFDPNSVQIIKNEDLELLKELGSGTYGTVYHGKWRGTDVAIKRIKKSCFTSRSSEQERLTTEFWREAEILSKLHHPNVLAFYGVVQDGPGETLATVTEFMVNGSLRHVLIAKERHLDRRKKLIIAMDAAFGMEYLHSKNIVHFDLKCDNLLVNLKDSSRPICKVGDFGLSKIKKNTLVTGGVRGTLPWMAPELLNGSTNKVSEKVDVFSFGIVLWEILTGEEPYANMHYGQIIGGIVNNTLRPPVPSSCDPEWRILMEQCWAPEPSDRPSFTEIARRLRTMSVACSTRPQPQNQQPK